MICAKCGATPRPGAKFCGSCGGSIVESPLGAPTPAPTTPPLTAPSVTPAPATEHTPGRTSIPGVVDALRPDEHVEAMLDLKQGRLLVTPERVLADITPDGGGNIVHIVERRAIRHVTTGFGWDKPQVLLGIIICLFSLGAVSVDDPAYSALIALTFLGVGLLVIYFAKKGAFVLHDVTGAKTSIPLKRTELDRAHSFVIQFGATIGV